MPSGGIAHFTQEGSTSIYNGDEGSNSVIDASGTGNSMYTLTASDESVWVFDDQGRIRSRTWPNGEVWTYDYYPTGGFDAGLLKSVSDDYGRSLQFAYIDNNGSYDDKNLKYVGDHSVSDIYNPIAGERFVQFGYTENKKDDPPVAGGQALLTSVQDVLGETWVYVYEDTDTDTLNWIIQEKSPSVDVDGDGATNGVITLKDLSYTILSDTISAITQKQGIFGTNPELMKTDYAFEPNDDEITTETIAGKTTVHNFFGWFYMLAHLIPQETPKYKA